MRRRKPRTPPPATPAAVSHPPSPPTPRSNNGRLAMIAIAAFTAQELVNGREIFEHLFVGFEKEIEAEEALVVREIGLGK